MVSVSTFFPILAWRQHGLPGGFLWLPSPFNCISLLNICMRFSNYLLTRETPFDLSSVRLIKNPLTKPGRNPLLFHPQAHSYWVRAQSHTRCNAATVPALESRPSIISRCQTMRPFRKNGKASHAKQMKYKTMMLIAAHQAPVHVLLSQLSP